MREFHIIIRNFEDVQAFVAMATVQPFRVTVCNDHQQVNGKNVMGMCSLDHSKPLLVRFECGEEDYSRFCQAAARFRA